MNKNKNQQRGMSPNQQRQYLQDQVRDSELKARYWKAQVEVMEYSIRHEELLPKYEAHQQRMKEQEKERIKQLTESLAKAQELGAEVQESDPDSTGVILPADQIEA